MHPQTTTLFRRFFLVGLTIVLTGFVFFTCTIPSFGAQPSGFSGFTQKQSYKIAPFSDVAPSDWFFDSVKNVYELGLMAGKSEIKFDPKGNITLGEAVSMAAKVHHIYAGGNGSLPKSELPSAHWYDEAISYARAQGIIEKSDFTHPDATATRAQLAYVFSRAVPTEALAPINAIQTLPDVTADTPYQENIRSLYRAGILSGMDAYGTFLPQASITRGEAASILYRIAIPKERRSFFLLPPKTSAGQERPTEKLKVFTDRKKTITLTAPTGWEEPLFYLSTDSQLTLSLKQPVSGSKRGSITVGEVVTYASPKKDAAAPLSVFHSLTAENLENELKGSTSVPVLLELSDKRPGYLSTLVSGEKDQPRYWILTAENKDQFITVIGRARKQDTVSTEDQVISILKTLTFLPSSEKKDLSFEQRSHF